jgi:hypothetical protein
MDTPVIPVSPPKRFCLRCGHPGPFRSELAQKCIDCDDATAEERRDYHKLYHQARGEAIKRLIQKHNSEFQRFLTEERHRLQRERERRAQKEREGAEA